MSELGSPRLPPPSPAARWKTGISAVQTTMAEQELADAELRKKAGIVQTRSKFEIKFETLSRLSSQSRFGVDT